MDISFAQKVFRIVQTQSKEVIEEQISGSDDIFSFLIPFGRKKDPNEIKVGEETEVLTREREEYRDRRGNVRPVTYRVVRIG